jgi:signal transduction histidine kinase
MIHRDFIANASHELRTPLTVIAGLLEPLILPRLTERFYRVDRARSSKSGETGLGLAIVTHVLNWHAASLSIASEVGRGWIFSCHFLPIREIERDEEKVTAMG